MIKISLFKNLKNYLQFLRILSFDSKNILNRIVTFWQQKLSTQKLQIKQSLG